MLMRSLPLFFILFLFQSAVYADSTWVKKIDSISAVVKNMYAPDKRVAYFESKMNPDGRHVLIETTEKEAINEFANLLKKENITLQVNASLLPSEDLNGKIYGIANLSVSNNRTTPGHYSELSTQMLLGTPVEVLKKERGYYLVRTPDKYLSWVDRAGVHLMSEQEFEEWKSAEKVVYTADHGYSFVRRSKSATRVSDLVQGDIIKLVSKGWGFYKVAYPDKRIAFIPKRNLEKYNKWVERPNPSAQKVLETAKTMIGVPYLWGGTSIKGVDCSGFTKTSYFLNGIILPRDASQQFMVGQPVDILDSGTFNLEKGLTNLFPGDLLFFATKDPVKGPNGKITHTAMYIGNGEFIQSAGLVKVSSLLPIAPNYDAFHKQTLVGARRILTAIGDPGITRINEHPWYKPLRN